MLGWIYVWKRLPRRDHKRKPKNIVKWFEGARKTGYYSNYIQPLGTYTVNLASLIWWLGEDSREVLLEEIFRNV